MRIAVCVKEVLDPDAVNNYAVAGRLEIGPDGKTLTQSAIPRLMNGYDEQAIEAALRLRDAGSEFTLAVISAGSDPEKMLKHAAALGAEELIAIQVDPEALDCHAFARLLLAQDRREPAAAWCRQVRESWMAIVTVPATDESERVTTIERVAHEVSLDRRVDDAG